MDSDHNNDNLTLIDTLIINILNDLTLEERFSIADLDENELRTLQLAMGKYMKFRIDQLNEQGTSKLLNDCRERSGDESMDDASTTVFVLKEIWKQLRQTHKIRVVK